MPDEKQVQMEVTRRYPRDGIEYPPGELITVPEHVAAAMEEASPPWGKRVADPTEPAPGRTRAPTPAPPRDG